MNKIKIYVGRVVVLAIICVLPLANTMAMEIVTPDGKRMDFESTVSNGKWNLIMLWAHDCIPCEQQKPMIGRFNKDHSNRGLVVHGLSTDSIANRKKALALLSKNLTNYSNYLFNGDNFERQYQAMIGESFVATPTYLVFDKKGELLGSHIGQITRDMLDNLFDGKLKRAELVPAADLLR